MSGILPIRAVVREVVADARLGRARRRAHDVVSNNRGLPLSDYRLLLFTVAGEVADATTEWNAALEALEVEARACAA